MFKALRKLSDEKGFTLVELLVVIAIIGILATLLILQLGVARSRARDAKRIADVNQIRSALELYFDDNGQYPNTTQLGNLLSPRYLQNLPQDPLSGTCSGYSGVAGCYGYSWSPTTGRAVRYQIWAELEQWAQALASDADVNSTTGGWGGSTINGGLDDRNSNCTTANNDCIYDQGQSQ